MFLPVLPKSKIFLNLSSLELRMSIFLFSSDINVTAFFLLSHLVYGSQTASSSGFSRLKISETQLGFFF